MEGYAYSYPDSGDSSPRSREIDFENPPSSWDDQPPPLHHKVKFMVSYGGKIQPRSHDNQLAYLGGETKILSVDRSIKFPSLLSKLTSLISEDSNSSSSSSPSLSSFKYQLPGEDLDALISVTNDDDLEHMMHEYDRLYRGSSKPARLRIFAFPSQSSGFGSAGSESGHRFVEALNSVPDHIQVQPPPVPVQVQVPVQGNNQGNVDFLFGLDNKGPGPIPAQIDARIQELNRLQISAQQENIGVIGDGYQKPAPTIPASVPIPASYWQQQPPPQPQPQPPPPQPQPPLEHHQPPHHQPPQHQPQQPPPPQSQPVYMIHTPPPASVYHAQVVRPMPGQQPHQGYYHQVQRVPSDPVYREQPVYQPPPQTMGVPVRPVGGMGETMNTGGAGYHVAYDSTTGRQVYYAAPGGPGVGVVTAPFQGGVTVTGSEGKVVQKGSPTSATV